MDHTTVSQCPFWGLKFYTYYEIYVLLQEHPGLICDNKNTEVLTSWSDVYKQILHHNLLIPNPL